MKHIGFLSFGHWQAAPWSRTPTARDALVQTIELAEAAEAIGLDGALRKVATQTYGSILLGVVASGFLAFALYSVSDARYRRI